MDLTTLDLSASNALRVADERLVILWSPTRGHFTVPVVCRHRGGPLNLGMCSDDQFVVCPWHHTRTRVPETGTRRAPVVFVRVGPRMTVLGDEVAVEGHLPARSRHQSPWVSRGRSSNAS